MTLRVGIMGHPLGHSVSPVFQQAAFDALGIDCRYEPWPTPPDRLAERFETLRDPGHLGANITVPHKVAALSLVDDLDPAASRIGAVNTVVRGDAGRLTGYNTDATGFVQSLRFDAGFDPSGCIAAIVGSGGAARAVAFGLADAGARELVIFNRTETKAHELRDAVQEGADARVRVAPMTGDHHALLSNEPLGLLVQCTSVGMNGGPDEGGMPEIAGGLVSETTLVCDLVYNPLDTPLLRFARERGAQTLEGLGMLVRQGGEAFTLWTGQPAPYDVMERAARRVLQPESNS